MRKDSKTCSLDLASARKKMPSSLCFLRPSSSPPGWSLKGGEMIFRLQTIITLFDSLYKRANERCCLACFIGDRDLAPAFLLHEKIHSKASFVLIPSTFHPPQDLFFCDSPLPCIPAPSILSLDITLRHAQTLSRSMASVSRPRCTSTTALLPCFSPQDHQALRDVS